MTDSERLQKIREIKSFGKPPVIEDDLYYTRSPWCSFAAVCGYICEFQDWYKDEIILQKATDEEIESVYNYMKNRHGKLSVKKRAELKPDDFSNISHFKPEGTSSNTKGVKNNGIKTTL